MRRRRAILVLASLCTAIAVGALSETNSAQAAGPADLYAKNTVTVLCETRAGGPTDLVVRLFASFWKEATGGTMVVENEPAGMGKVCVNKLFAAKPNGLTLGGATIGIHVLMPVLFREPGAMWDYQKFQWIGILPYDVHLLAIGTREDWGSMEEMQKRKVLKMGAPDPICNSSINLALLASIYDLKEMKIVTGLRGSEIGPAVGRGDLNGYIMPEQNIITDMKNGFVKKPLLCMDLERSRAFPDVPAVAEAVKLSKDQERVLEIVRYQRLSKGFFAPPGTAEENVRYLREVFDRIYRMDSFQTKLKAGFQVWGDPIRGEAVAPLLKKASETSKEEIDRIKGSVMKHVPH